MPNLPIGIFDSGIGGLSVARAIIDLLPSEPFLYFGDTARIPYGTKPADTIRQYSLDITRYLIESGAKAIVVACNTASAAALGTLRAAWPDIPIVGMEPAVKPGANATQTGVVGVLATAGTFKSQRYADLMQRYASGITLLEDPCIGLVEQIEAGELNTSATRQLLETILLPMIRQQADTFVLGCTHYPLVRASIERMAERGEAQVCTDGDLMVRLATYPNEAPANWLAKAAVRRQELLDSAGKVKSGAELVSESGATLEEIVGAVKKVGDIVAEIAAASAEQSAGIDQVNQAVTSMDEVTQQNAALAEQTSAASRSLDDKTVELESMMSFFKVG